MDKQMNSMGMSQAGSKGGGSLNILYSPPTSYQVPLANPRMGQPTSGNVNQLINQVPRTGGTQIIN